MAKVEDKDETIGQAPVKYTGNSLYLTYGGGEFTHGKVKGSFASDAAGTAIVVYIENGGSYVCDVKDVIRTAIEHHKKKQ